MDGTTAGMSITIEPRLLQAPSSTALIDREHAVRLRMQEACLYGPRVGTVDEKGHSAFKITKDS